MRKVPDYSKYSLYQLDDVYNHVDRDKYPVRFQMIVDELNKRKADPSLRGIDDALSEYDQLLRVKTDYHYLPISPIIKEALKLPWQNRVIMTKALIIPFIVGTALLFIHSFYSDSSGLIFAVLYRLAYGFIFTVLAISCHRLVLLGDASVPKYGICTWTMRETRFLGWCLLAGFLSGIDDYLKAITSSITNDGNLWLSITRAVTIPVGLYLSARLSVILPATAIDKKPDLRWVWDITKGNGFRVLYISIILFLLILLSSMIIILMPIYYIYDKGTISNLFFCFIINIALLADIVALSLSYKYLTKKGT